MNDEKREGICMNMLVFITSTAMSAALAILPLSEAAAASAAAASTAAAAAGTSAQYAKCIEKAEAVDPKIADCMRDEWERQDKRLNAAYRKLLSISSAGQKKKLQEAQRFWVKYTEANCGFYYDPDGGTAARQSASECAIDARVHRAQELEERIEVSPGSSHNPDWSPMRRSA